MLHCIHIHTTPIVLKQLSTTAKWLSITGISWAHPAQPSSSCTSNDVVSKHYDVKAQTVTVNQHEHYLLSAKHHTPAQHTRSALTA